MMKLNKIFRALIITSVLAAQSLFAGDAWVTNIDEAIKLSKKENKPIFVEFTGSDWCPPCIMMDKNVFSKRAFLTPAKKDFILVKIDTPKADKNLTAKNEKVLEKYRVLGVPTVVLLDSNGKEFGRFMASKYSSVDTMLAELKRRLRLKDMF